MLNVSLQGVMVLDIETNKEFIRLLDVREEWKDGVDIFAFTYDRDNAPDDIVELPKGIHHVIFMNKQVCIERNAYLQVLFHEFGHVFNQLNGFEDTEANADDFAYDMCEENGVDTEIFREWAEDNYSLYTEERG